MDDSKRKRSTYVTRKQKKKLMHLMAKYPELMSGARGRISEGFNAQQLWLQVANECNAIPGAKKHWRQWRKSWQDIKSKIKKKQEQYDTEIPSLEQGLKNVSSTTNYQDGTEFVNSEEILENNFISEVDTLESFSETDEEVEDEKVLSQLKEKKIELKPILESETEHSIKCNFNCETLIVQEKRKLEIKEDYYNFRKDYLRQKLLILQEQTEALKSIAKVLAK